MVFTPKYIILLSALVLFEQMSIHLLRLSTLLGLVSNLTEQTESTLGCLKPWLAWSRWQKQLICQETRQSHKVRNVSHKVWYTKLDCQRYLLVGLQTHKVTWVYASLKSKSASTLRPGSQSLLHPKVWESGLFFHSNPIHPHLYGS